MDCPTRSVEKRWNHIHSTIYKSTRDNFGKEVWQISGWFEKAGINEPVIMSKQVALLIYKKRTFKKASQRTQED